MTANTAITINYTPTSDEGQEQHSQPSTRPRIRCRQNIGMHQRQHYQLNHPNRQKRNFDQERNQKPMTRLQPTKVIEPNDETTHQHEQRTKSVNQTTSVHTTKNNCQSHNGKGKTMHSK
jgi:hypothetical protein